MKKFNTFCLMGFGLLIVSLLWIAIYLIGRLWLYDIEYDPLLPLGVLCFLAGTVISIIGIVNSGKNGQRGRGLAVGGILSVVFTVVLIFAAAVINFILDRPAEFPPTTATTDSWDTWATGTMNEKCIKIYGSGPETIDLWSYTDEVPRIVKQYIKQNPGFGEKYTVECTIIDTDGGRYEEALDKALAAGGDEAPDIYVTESAFVYKYSKGDMAYFAMPYEDLGIDVDTKIKEADIAEYSVDIGTYIGKVVALGYQSTGGVMIYNAEIAKDVFGTDDPEEIEKITGAGSGNWDKFLEAAEKLKEKGYAAVSGPSDIWKACENSADKGWIVEDSLYIDPKRADYLDLSKTIIDNGYSNNTRSWLDPWYLDMQGGGEKKVFAYFGPAWLINFVMARNSGGNKIGEGTYGQWRVCAPPAGFFWGGTWLLANKNTDCREGVAELIEWITLDTSETGLQYLWANGLVDWDNDPDTVTPKDTVVSAVVMAKSDGTLDFCGGQDIFPAFIEGNKYASAKAVTQYDEVISDYFEYAASQYAEGNVIRDTAIYNFRKSVYDDLSL